MVIAIWSYRSQYNHNVGKAVCSSMRTFSKTWYQFITIRYAEDSKLCLLTFAATNQLRSKSDQKKLLFSSSEEDEVSAEAVLSPAPPRSRPIRSRQKSNRWAVLKVITIQNSNVVSMQRLVGFRLPTFYIIGYCYEKYYFISLTIFYNLEK